METGIISYGVAVPRHRIEARAIWETWKNMAEQFFDLLSIGERGVFGPDEDTITLAAAAAKQALSRAGISKDSIRALFLRSCTSPYSRRSAATVIQDALGLPAAVLTTDIQCAEKSGSTALLLAAALI